MNLLLTADNDLAIVDGSLKLITGVEEITQKIKQVLTCSKADWFLDLDLGLPFFQQLLQKSTSAALVEATYLTTISAIPGVLDILEFRLDYEPTTRSASIAFKVSTSDGVIDFNQEI